MKTVRKMPIRLAFRQEGSTWNCYLARADTMDGAKIIGSIAMGAVQNPEVKRLFMDAMKLALADAAEDVTGTRPNHFEESVNQ